MPFTCDQELTITQTGEQTWRLEQEVAYFDSKYIEDIVVPKGFTCDGSSIPSFAWQLVGHPLYGNSAICGFLHDYLYRVRVNRLKADQAFLEAHTDLGTSAWKRSVYYWAVRTFGWIPYMRYKNGQTD